jgi:hypothetical protein
VLHKGLRGVVLWLEHHPRIHHMAARRRRALSSGLTTSTDLSGVTVAVRTVGTVRRVLPAPRPKRAFLQQQFPMLSRDLRGTRNTGSIRLPDRSRHLPAYEVRLAINRAIAAGTSLRQFRQLHSYAASLRCVVWPHLLHMCLPSTCATMRRNSKPDTQ